MRPIHAGVPRHPRLRLVDVWLGGFPQLLNKTAINKGFPVSWPRSARALGPATPPWVHLLAGARPKRADRSPGRVVIDGLARADGLCRGHC